MIILDVNKLTKNFGFGPLFENVSFSLNEGESISIVGPNGCGKSTLLKIIAGLEKADSGLINIKKGAKVGYLNQTTADKSDSRKVSEILFSVFEELNTIKEKINNIEKLLQENSSDKLIEKYCKLIEEYSRLGGYELDAKIGVICAGLEIKPEVLSMDYNSLSGGQKTLIQLACVLLLKPELLLLDEPTNHLDIKRIEWLEDYVKSFKGATVIVSHDRYFLDKMSNKILDLTNLEPKVYTANYSGYLELKEADFQKQMENFKDQQILIKRMKEQIKYFAERGMATNSSTMCNRAHALQTQLNRLLKNKIEKPHTEKKYNLEFSEEKKASKRVLETKNLTVKVPNGKTILNNINLTITSKERIALIGNNGSGKSTFIKTILGESSSLEISGECVIGDSTKIGYLPQIINFENENLTLFDYFSNEIAAGEEKTRRVLNSFGFDYEDTNKLIKNLSGGERIRIRLAILLEKNVNCLIFDEPTNHIDISTKEMLEKSISKFNGTFIFVSHDRYFINKFADKVIEFENTVTQTHIGGYDDYKRKKLKNM